MHCADSGRAAWLLHDVGKYTQAFQARLTGSAKRVDHSTAGAKIAIGRYGSTLARLLAFSIAAHDHDDEVLEPIYIGRRFRNDTERLEKQFEMYAPMTYSRKVS